MPPIDRTTFEQPLPQVCLYEPSPNVRCVCEVHASSQIEPALLGAVGILLIAFGVLGYAIGRVRRLRSKLQITQSQA